MISNVIRLRMAHMSTRLVGVTGARMPFRGFMDAGRCGDNV